MRTLLACAVGLALSGCSTGLMKTEDASSSAVRAAFAAQVIEPAGVAGDTAPPAGLDGRAARQAQERYEKSFGAKESARTYAPDMGAEK